MQSVLGYNKYRDKSLCMAVLTDGLSALSGRMYRRQRVYHIVYQKHVSQSPLPLYPGLYLSRRVFYKECFMYWL